jgi:hypothetical protein
VKVRTFFYEFDIEFMSKGDLRWRPDTGSQGEEEEASAYTDFDHETIFVRDDLTQAMTADSVLHELLHVATLAGGVAEGQQMTEEQFVSCATAGLKQILVMDNDELWEYLGVNL